MTVDDDDNTLSVVGGVTGLERGPVVRVFEQMEKVQQGMLLDRPKWATRTREVNSDFTANVSFIAHTLVTIIHRTEIATLTTKTLNGVFLLILPIKLTYDSSKQK